MSLKIQKDEKKAEISFKNSLKLNDRIFSIDYVDFLNDAGWKLEKILPSNRSQYSDLLEDTDWKSTYGVSKTSIHIRRDLDALS